MIKHSGIAYVKKTVVSGLYKLCFLSQFFFFVFSNRFLSQFLAGSVTSDSCCWDTLYLCIVDHLVVLLFQISGFLA